MSRFTMRHVAPLTAAAWAVALLAAEPAHAQTASASAASPPAAATGWEIEFTGGLAAGRTPGGGSVSLPPAGAAITTSSPIFPSRAVPSWFFGDGAALFNDAAAELNLPDRIASLDDALAARALQRGAGVAFGVRVRRGLTPRASLELGMDVSGDSPDLTGDFRAAVDASRASFEAAFGELFASGPFDATAVDATASVDAGASREIALTGALNIGFAPRGAFVPYITLGGGVLTRAGSLPSATLAGRYQTRIAVAGAPTGGPPIDESDRLVIRFDQGPALVGVAGGGLRRDLSPRWALHLDARALVGRDTTRVLVDATPSVTAGSPAGSIESLTYPNIQFSNDPAVTGRRSTLGAPPLDSFIVRKGDGWRVRVFVSVGVVVRL